MLVQQIKAFLKRTPLYTPWRDLRGRYAAWREKRIIPPYDEKRRIIDSYRTWFRIKTLVETGTCLGDTVEAMRHSFDRVVSIELSPELAAHARERFEGAHNVELHEGDSGGVLPAVLATLNGPALFWLDGHYSYQFRHDERVFFTAKGVLNTPIVNELQCILADREQGHVILIDDARCFTGQHDYPRIAQLRDLIAANPTPRNLQVMRDIIRIVPRQ